jgi:hypothetical protein
VTDGVVIDGSVDHLGVVELIEICSRMEARNEALFELLGSWVRDEEDPALQRWYAEACQRHAWHSQLWAARKPSIAGSTASGSGEAVELEPTTTEVGGRLDRYRRALSELGRAVHDLSTRIDPDLDPSTRRVIQLVGDDLARLANAAGAGS